MAGFALALAIAGGSAQPRPTFHFTKTTAELDLVVLSVADLGLPEDGASLEATHSRAVSIGLELCPPYLNQPRGEFLHIAMRLVARYGREPADEAARTFAKLEMLTT